MDPLRAYKSDDVVIQLPGEMTVFNIDWLSIYDVKAKTNFGFVIIPDGLNVPPSLVKVNSKYTLTFFFFINSRGLNYLSCYSLST